ncbi:MAG: hypothetical protein GX620_10635 [Chloroflexi bacterium]|nr:hypothetical protein [Chloroflexota bacterium]
MAGALDHISVTLDAARTHQTIDGFGVNFNSKYWGAKSFDHVMDLLVDDLGATLFRVDIWGKSNWVDPEDAHNARVLNEETYRTIYQGEVFRKGWAAMRYLNERGIEPYLTASGIVPTWMLGEDGKTLAEYDLFCEMLASMVDWARNREGLRFTYLGPLNETDIGEPEGPTVGASEYARVMEVLDRKLTERGLDDIRFVVPEQAHFNSDYVTELLQNDRVRNRIGAVSMHTYFDYPVPLYAEVADLVRREMGSDARVWLGEYGDLEQSGEREWYVGWVSTRRLLDALEAGFSGGIFWDAFDNYHDHNEAWTIYGLMRTGLFVYTPKKRYFAAKQVYRYVRPGFQRVEIETARPEASTLASDSPERVDRGIETPGLRLMGFVSPDGSDFTLVGMNASDRGYFLDVRLEGCVPDKAARRAAYFRTTEREDCVRAGSQPLVSGEFIFAGANIEVPGQSIFTLTTVE